MPPLNRRRFILGTAGTAGALVVGWLATPTRDRLSPSTPLATKPGQSALNGWVKVSNDNTVTIVMSQAEMGQGTHTGLAMLLADEMDADWGQVKCEQSTLDAIYNNQAAILGALIAPDDHGYLSRVTTHLVGKVMREIPGLLGTGGSSSLTDQWRPMREAGASARAMLIATAAKHWSVPAHECHADSGRVLHVTGRSISFGELASAAALLDLPKDVTLKQPGQFKLIGRPLRRLDNAAKLNGSAIFGIDVLAPGLLYASITMCPTMGGRVANFDATAARALPGVRTVVALDPVAGSNLLPGTTAGAVAVIADTPFRAMRALDALKIEWQHGIASALSSRSLFDELRHSLDTQKGKVHFECGDVGAAMKSAAKIIEAEYQVPFLAHATMEPMNCTVQFEDGAATVWAPTQAAGFASKAVAKVLGIKQAKVEVKVPYLGGGFGRRYYTDFIVQAAMLARETRGVPVQLLWSREQDMSHDYYRPAYVSRCKAAFDTQGKLTAWATTSAGSSMGALSLLYNTADGAADTGYVFTNARVAHQAVESAVSIGIWRSVAHSQNAFFTECFVDECAVAAARDPVAFRAELLNGNSRHLRVLQRAAELARWDQPLIAVDGVKRGRGVAFHRAFGTVVTQIAEVSLTPEKRIRVHRVICVVDCGVAINPNLIRQQMEGAIVYGLSAALLGEITIENGQVQQSNFHDYPVLRIDECPIIEVEILASGETPGGVGEPGTPPIAAAVANAVYSLTGLRLRSLPLRIE